MFEIFHSSPPEPHGDGRRSRAGFSTVGSLTLHWVIFAFIVAYVRPAPPDASGIASNATDRVEKPLAWIATSQRVPMRRAGPATPPKIVDAPPATQIRTGLFPDVEPATSAPAVPAMVKGAGFHDTTMSIRSTADANDGRAIIVGALSGQPQGVDGDTNYVSGGRGIVVGLLSGQTPGDGGGRGGPNAVTPGGAGLTGVPNGSDTVDQPAKLLTEIKADYPENARQENVTGEVRLEVELMAAGTVRYVRTLSGFGSDFEQAAIAAVERALVRPAVRAGHAVSVRGVITVFFKLM